MTIWDARIDIDYLVNLIENSTNAEETYKNNLKLFKKTLDKCDCSYIRSEAFIFNAKKWLTIIRFCFECNQDEIENSILQDILNNLVFLVNENFFELEPSVTKNIIGLISENFNYLSGLYKYSFGMYTCGRLDFFGISQNEFGLIKKLIGLELKDAFFLKSLLESRILLNFFAKDIDGYLNFLDNVDYVDYEYIKKMIESQFEYLLKNEFFSPLLELIMRNNESPLWKSYLTDSKRRKILEMAISAPITELTNEQIKFFLNLIKNSNFVKELGENYLFVFRNNCAQLINEDLTLPEGLDIDREEIAAICSKLGLCSQIGIDIEKKGPKPITDKKSIYPQNAYENAIMGYHMELEDAIIILKLFLKERLEYDPILMSIVLRSIVICLKKQLNIENGGVYLHSSHKNVGRYIYNSDSISINILCCFQKGFSIFEVFPTLFHEIDHNTIEKKQRLGFFDGEIYEKNKQSLMEKYDPSFYKRNYEILQGEMDARIAGLNQLQKFVETYLPEYLDELQDDLIEKLEKEKAMQKEKKSNKMIVLGKKIEFQTAFDALIRYNPDILEQHPILKLEYYKNGQPKTYEDIWLERTEENKDLIDGILRIRYPEPTSQTLNTSHTK